MGKLLTNSDLDLDHTHTHKCDVMGQNKSHVAKHKMAEICILTENVKICPCFHQKQNICVSFCHLN